MMVKACGMMSGAMAGLALGSFWAIWFPINKRLWTSSYVLFAAGWTLLVLAICYFAIEIKKHRGAWTFPGMVFGSNAIVVYVFSELLSTVLEIIHVGHNGETVGLKQWIFTRIFASIVNVQFGSLLYSLSFVLVCFVPAFLLYRKHIFIKV